MLVPTYQTKRCPNSEEPNHLYPEDGGMCLSEMLVPTYQTKRCPNSERKQLYPEDGGVVFLQNVGTHLPD
jgi:hypothetical protein